MFSGVDSGRPKGAILTMAKELGLADLWFGDYASPDWKRKSPAQAMAIFGGWNWIPVFGRFSA